MTQDELSVERRDRLRDVLRGRRHRHPASASQIAERFGDVLEAVRRPLMPERARRMRLVDERDGWLAMLAADPGMRAQPMIWAFTPDGRLRRHPDEQTRHAWDRAYPGDEVDALLRRWSDPVS